MKISCRVSLAAVGPHRERHVHARADDLRLEIRAAVKINRVVVPVVQRVVDEEVPLVEFPGGAAQRLLQRREGNEQLSLAGFDLDAENPVARRRKVTEFTEPSHGGDRGKQALPELGGLTSVTSVSSP